MPPATRLNGVSILVLEDNFVLADCIARTLQDAGATVIGPFPQVDAAREALASQRPDCAILDINLGSGPSFAIANAARELGIPFILTTGYDKTNVPRHFANVTLLQKPIQPDPLVRAVAEVCRSV